MGRRSVEVEVRTPSGELQRLRVDLHGVSTFGPGDEHTAIRWEWIDHLAAGDDGEVVVRSAQATITIPARTFGLVPDALVAQLQRARSITERTDVIAELS